MDELSSCPQNRHLCTNTHLYEESNKLELTLAPPGPHKWSTFTTILQHTSSHQHDDPLLSLGHHHHQPWPSSSSPKFPHFSPPNNASSSAKGVKESSLHHSSTKMSELQQTRNNNDPAEKIGFLPSVSDTNTAVFQKRYNIFAFTISHL